MNLGLNSPTISPISILPRYSADAAVATKASRGIHNRRMRTIVGAQIVEYTKLVTYWRPLPYIGIISSKFGKAFPDKAELEYWKSRGNKGSHRPATEFCLSKSPCRISMAFKGDTKPRLLEIGFSSVGQLGARRSGSGVSDARGCCRKAVLRASPALSTVVDRSGKRP